MRGGSSAAAVRGHMEAVESSTDDTLRYIAVLKAFSKRQPICRTLVEYYSGRRGYGRRMDAMLSKGKCVPAPSWGNAAATRKAELALFDRARLGDVIKYCRVTHTHAESETCCKAVFVAVRCALRHCRDLTECWQILGEKHGLSHCSAGIRAGESIPPALIVFEESQSFGEALRNAICLGGDTDSIGAVAGALAGGYYGVPREFLRALNKERRIVREILSYLPD